MLARRHIGEIARSRPSAFAVSTLPPGLSSPQNLPSDDSHIHSRHICISAITCLPPSEMVSSVQKNLSGASLFGVSQQMLPAAPRCELGLSCALFNDCFNLHSVKSCHARTSPPPTDSQFHFANTFHRKWPARTSARCVGRERVCRV